MSEPIKMPEQIWETIKRFQQVFPGVEKKRFNQFTNSHYASLDDVWNAVLPKLDAVGLDTLAWVETIVVTGPGGEASGMFPLSTLKVCLYNKDRQQVQSELPLPNAMEAPQKVGGALTYYRRYLICTMLGVVAEADDDGNSAGGDKNTTPSIDADQLKKINELVPLTNTAKSDLLAFIEESYRKAAIEHLSYAEAATIIKMLEHKQNTIRKAP
jgi:hypothetical protein